MFEDYFTELQTDMVAICLEYLGGRTVGDNIYIYCSFESNVYSVGYFYRINGILKKRHKINEEILQANVSVERQGAVMKILMADLKEIKTVCDRFERPMPTEIKLNYHIQTNKLNAQLKYDPVFEADSEKTADDIEQA